MRAPGKSFQTLVKLMKYVEKNNMKILGEYQTGPKASIANIPFLMYITPMLRFAFFATTTTTTTATGPVDERTRT